MRVRIGVKDGAGESEGGRGKARPKREGEQVRAKEREGEQGRASESER